MAERNMALVHRFFRAYHSGSFDDLLAADFSWRGSLVSHTAVFSQAITQWRAAFPDGRFQVDAIATDGSRVLTNWTFTGTHQGSWPGTSSSGQRVTLLGATTFDIHDNRITAVVEITDRLTLWQQLGLLSTPTLPAAPTEISVPHYIEDSLRSKDDGFAFNVQNPEDDCTLLSIPSFRIDGETITTTQIVMVTMNGSFRAATAVSAARPLTFPANTTLRFQVSQHRLAAGPHDVELVLELAETAVPLTISFTDELPG